MPEKINSSIYFSYASEKELEVIGKESIKKIVMILSDMKVRKELTFTKTYSPKLKNTYRLELYCGNNEIQRINILNSKYIQINQKNYKVIGKSNLSKIYEIIILDQPEGTLDQFYYDVININE